MGKDHTHVHVHLTHAHAGVAEVGNQVMESAGVMFRLMSMAQSNNPEAQACHTRITRHVIHSVQCAAAEAISHAASDKKRCRGVLMEVGA